MSFPKFINSLYLKNLIESKYDQKDVVVKKHSVESKSGYVYRISVRYTSRQTKDSTIGLIVLIKPKEEVAEVTKEFKMLNEILPIYVDAIRLADQAIHFNPKIISSEKQPVEMIVLEDVAQLGYTAARVSKGLTIEQSRVAVEKLAALHAASAIHLKNASAEFKTKFGKKPLHSSTTYFEEALANFIGTAESIKMPGSVVNKLTVLQRPLLETSAADFGASLNGFEVLNHGNAWTNNILFMFKNGQPVDALLIDFKRSVIGSPVLDLMYLFTTSVAFDVMKDYKDEILYTYHSKLNKLLGALNYDGHIPTLLEFQCEFFKRGILELLLTLTVSPYLRTPNCAVQPKLVHPILTEAEKEVDLEKLSKLVLATHGEDIIEELNVVEHNGLLDWGVDKSHVKKLLNAFQ